MRSVGRSCALVGLVVVTVLAASALDAQQRTPVTVMKLQGVGTPLGEVFGRISAVRELRDGRVIVSDDELTRLVVADFTSGAVQQIGRKGQGPGEYQQVARIWPLPGDSTLVKEPWGTRWLLLAGARVVATLGLAERVVTTAGMMPLQGSDTLGHVITTTFGRDARGAVSPDAPFALLRIDRRTMRVDTVARLQNSEMWRKKNVSANEPSTVPAGPSSGGARPRRYAVPILVPDDVAVFADGWIAIVRPDPYRVDWCSPRGTCTEGAALSKERIAMTAREKQAYLEAARAEHLGPKTDKVEETFGWPSYVPPFASPSGLDGSAVLAMPDGRAMVSRLPTADARMNRYDIVTRSGVVAAQLHLPLNERVIGFGAKTIYIRRVDADGDQYLRRHAWP
jgi:hypothetical protein